MRSDEAKHELKQRDPRRDPRKGDVVKTDKATRKVYATFAGFNGWAVEFIDSRDRIISACSLESWRRWCKGAQEVKRG
jgi:hypothetical protein